QTPSTRQILSTGQVLQMKEHLKWIYTDARIEDYILRLVLSTRREIPLEAHEADLSQLKDIRASIRIGASPRASLFLYRASRAHAFLNNRLFVTPDDVKSVAFEVLRHRLILTFDAEARGLNTDQIISQLLNTVTIP
ncbi:ATPase, partial [bacterium]|nr:ATPase [bacterium]